MTTFFIGSVCGLLLGTGVGWWIARQSSPVAAPLFTQGEDTTQQLDAAHAAVAERTAKRLNRIVAAATAAGQITNDGVEDLFCISDRTASTYLRMLTDANRLTRQGIGRGTYYTPVE